MCTTCAYVCPMQEKESLTKGVEEKLRLQQVQREADLEIAKELFDTGR